MNIKWRVFIPIGVLFGSPWMHKIVYMNILAAWPETDPVTAHGLGFFGTCIAVFATLIVGWGP